MSKDIYILGAGGFAKEVLHLINEINQVNCDEYSFKGFIDREEEQEVIGSQSFPIYAEDKLINSINSEENLHFAIGVGSPELIEKLSSKFKPYGTFPNLIHPNFTGNLDDIVLGEGNIITAGNSFTTSIKINSFNIFNLNCTLGHDSIIESYNVINPGVNISGGVFLGNKSLIGTGAKILQYINITDDTIIGAGSVVVKSIIESGTYVGIPAKKIR